jgi:hypothetical protein
LPPCDLVSPEVNGSIDGSEPLPNSDNPQQIVGPFGTELDAIASETAIPRQNLYHRCVQIMKDISPASDWSAEAEKKLRKELSAVGLKLPFRRPRAAVARRAVFRIVAELVDAGILNTEESNGLSRLLRFYDLYFVTAQPGWRPREIQSMAGVTDSGTVKDDGLVKLTTRYPRSVATSRTGSR